MLSANDNIDLIMNSCAKRTNSTVPKGQPTITNNTFMWNTLDNEYDSDNGVSESFVIKSGTSRKLSIFYGKYLSVTCMTVDKPDVPSYFIVDGNVIASRCDSLVSGRSEVMSKRYYAQRNKTVTIEAFNGSFNYILGDLINDDSDSDSDMDTEPEYVFSEQYRYKVESDSECESSDAESDFEEFYRDTCRCSEKRLDAIVNRDVLQEQIDDFGDDVKPKKKHTVNTNAPTKKLSATSALNMLDTPMSIQGIETVDVVTGSERTISRLTTPDGPRDVIHLANTAIRPNHKLNYMPSTFLPTAAYVWNPATSTTAVLNDRVAHYMSPYAEYHCQYLFRLLAKPSLFTNSRVWVSLKDTSTVGFEWSPAEENDIYVLVPWQELDLTKSTTDTSCPTLQITDLSSTIYATGTATSIEYSMFVAPFNMFLYRPLPVAAFASASLNEVTGSASQTLTVSADSLVLCSTAIIADGTAEASIRITDGVNINDTLYQYGTIPNNSITPTIAIPAGTYSFDKTNITAADITCIHLSTSTATFNTGKLGLFPDYVDDGLPSYTHNLQEQIMELSYDENFADNQAIIGKPGPHTVHADSHWNFISKMDFNTADDSVFFAVDVAKDARSRRDLQKYNQYSKYPVVMFTAASIPTSNALFRITQDPNPFDPTTELMSLGDALQLPGVEWDPKTGPLYLQPYWDTEYPTRYTDDPHTIVYHMHILAGTLVEPISVVSKVNYASVEYHNYFIDHATFNPTQGLVEQIEEFEPSTTLSTTENLKAESTVNVADPVEVEVSSPVVKAMDDQTQELVTGLASRYEFVHSTTFGPDVAVFYYAMNYNMLGRDAFDEYIGYEYFTGKPRFKICMSCGTATAADAHIVQLPPTVDVANLTYADWVKIVKSRPSGAVSVRDGSYEVEMEWMVPNVRSSRDTFLGYLAVVMPFSNQDGSAPQYLPSEIIMSLFTDSGNVSFQVDRVNTDPAADTYIDPVFDTLARPSASRQRQQVDPLSNISLNDNVLSLAALLREILGVGNSFVERGAPLDQRITDCSPLSCENGKPSYL